MNPLLSALYIVRGPAAVAAITFVLLTVPNQTREIYRVLALDLGEALARGAARPGADGMWELLKASSGVVLAVLSVAIASLVVWYVGRSVTRQQWYLRREDSPARADAPNIPQPWIEVLLDWLPRICGASILAGFGYGLWLSDVDLLALNIGSSKTAQEALGYARAVLRWGSALAAILAILFLLLTYLRTRVLSIGSRQQDKLFAWPIRLACYALWSALVLVVVVFPVTVPQLVGTVPVSMLFVIISVFTISMLLRVADRDEYGIPLFSLLLLWLLLASGFDWNDNHAVRTVISPSATEASSFAQSESPPMARKAFEEWLRQRSDRGFYRDQNVPYPVFIITASGGGLYAAHFAAATLARLQDDCPGFAQHVFAISGVSGGSVGATLFSALAGQNASNGDWQDCLNTRAAGAPGQSYNNRGALESATSQLLDRDLMSPIAAAAYFPDLALSIIPSSLIGLDRWLNFDRARAFELSLEAAWDDLKRSKPGVAQSSGNPLASPFLDHWRASKAAPALLLNTTEVSRGHRVVVSPFKIIGSNKVFWNKLLWYREPGYIERGLDVSLATAAGLSARFPWILPAASHEIRVSGETRKIRLVDGGVFENSGVETAIDLLSELKQFESRSAQDPLPPVKFYLLSIGDFEDYFPRYVRGFSEIMSPVRALLSARSSRASFALSRADERLCANVRENGRDTEGEAGTCIRAMDVDRDRPSHPLQPIYLNQVDHVLTLGWQLSRLTLGVLQDYLGLASECRLDILMPQRRAPAAESDAYWRPPYSFPEPEVRQIRIKNNNNCTACAVRHILAGAKQFQSGEQPCGSATARGAPG
jgi:hypothetical protein